MAGHDILVIGASAGGVEALTRLVRGLPEGLPAAVFVVLHLPAHGTSVLPGILSRSGPLPAAHPDDGEEIKPGRIYVAPPDVHLLVGRGRVRISRGPKENGHRPAVDVLFRTAARSYGRRVVGVVLSGALDDGAAGLAAIKSRGGLAVVQDPADALYPGMPRSALETVPIDHVAPVSELPGLLARLASGPVDLEGADDVPDDMELEAEFAAFDLGVMENGRHHPGHPSGWACPDCGGALWEMQDGELFRFRCRVGHAWSANSLLAEQHEAMEAALWTALRALEERAALADRLAERLIRSGSDRVARRFREQAHEARQRGALIRQVLMSDPGLNADAAPVPASSNGGPPHPGESRADA